MNAQISGQNIKDKTCRRDKILAQPQSIVPQYLLIILLVLTNRKALDNLCPEGKALFSSIRVQARSGGERDKNDNFTGEKSGRQHHSQ